MRKHIRLADWDYSSEGIYFLTICCHERQSFFGKIIENKMVFSETGSIALQCWKEIPHHFPHVKLDEFVIMPNHIHGILILDYSLVGKPHDVGSCHGDGTPNDTVTCHGVGSCHGMTLHSNHDEIVGTRHGVSLPNNGVSLSNNGVSLPGINTSNHGHSSNQNINQFSKPLKNSVSVIINQYKSSVKRWCNKNGFNHFHWQPRFYDKILRDNDSLENVRYYIRNNPGNWKSDELFI